MDYFLRQDVRAKALAKDSVELSNKLQLKDESITLLKDNCDDLKSSLRNQEILTGNYKQEAANNLNKYYKANDKAKRRMGIIIGSVSVNIMFVTVFAIKFL